MNRCDPTGTQKSLNTVDSEGEGFKQVNIWQTGKLIHLPKTATTFQRARFSGGPPDADASDSGPCSSSDSMLGTKLD